MQSQQQVVGGSYFCSSPTLEMKPMQVMQWFIAIKSLLVGHKVSLSKKKAVLGVILCIMQPYRRVSLIRKPKNDF